MTQGRVNAQSRTTRLPFPVARTSQHAVADDESTRSRGSQVQPTAVGGRAQSRSSVLMMRAPRSNRTLRRRQGEQKSKHATHTAVVVLVQVVVFVFALGPCPAPSRRLRRRPWPLSWSNSRPWFLSLSRSSSSPPPSSSSSTSSSTKLPQSRFHMASTRWSTCLIRRLT